MTAFTQSESNLKPSSQFDGHRVAGRSSAKRVGSVTLAAALGLIGFVAPVASSDGTATATAQPAANNAPASSPIGHKPLPGTLGGPAPSASLTYDTFDAIWKLIQNNTPISQLKIDIPDIDPGGFAARQPLTTTATPGTLLDSQPTTFAVGIPLVDWTKSESTRVAYASTTYQNKRVPVTGTVIRSSHPWKAATPRPLLVVTPGTQGNAPACSPSKLMPLGLYYEASVVAAALLRGWDVAVTDFIGLGTKIQHSYMNRVDQGNAALDIARTATRMFAAEGRSGGLPANQIPVATIGYSQGGGGSAAALELASSYAPDVNIIGGVANGTPANLQMTAEAIDRKPLTGAIGYMMNGVTATNPEIHAAFMERMTPEGRHFLESTQQACVTDSVMKHAYADSRTWFKDGSTLAEVLKLEPFKSVIAQQQIGNIPPKVPVFVGTGTHDDVIPSEEGRALARAWCSQGVKVKYLEHNNTRIAPLFDHLTPKLTLIQNSLKWLDAVARNEPYDLTPCADIPSPDAPRPAAPLVPKIKLNLPLK